MIPVFAEAPVDITIRHYELDDAGPLLDAALESVSEVGLKAGAHREGVLRSRLHLHDQALDAVIFSLVRTDLLPCLEAPGEATDDR